MSKLIAIALLLPGLAGCALTGGESRVRIADGLEFDLLAPATYGASLLLVQVASIRFGDSTRDLLFHTEITPEAIAIVGTLPGGARLFSITYDGQAIASDGSSELFNNISPAYLLADLQLAQWPLALVADSLQAANPCFDAGQCAVMETIDKLNRSLTVAGSTVISIDYSALPAYLNALVYAHHQRGYQLQFETLDAELLQGPAP